MEAAINELQKLVAARETQQAQFDMFKREITTRIEILETKLEDCQRKIEKIMEELGIDF